MIARRLAPLIAAASLASACAGPAAAQLFPRVPGLSPAGSAMIAAEIGHVDPTMQVLGERRRVIADALARAAARPQVDVAEVAALLDRERETEDRLRARRNDRTVALLRALPLADRAPFLRSLRAPTRLTIPRPEPR